MRASQIPVLGSRLQRRIILIIALGTLLMALVLGVSGYLAVKESIDRTLEERLALATMTASYVDYTLRQSLLRLEEVAVAEGVNLADDDLAPERRALRNAYFQTIFNDQVFLADRAGRVFWSEPQGESARGMDISIYPYVREAIGTGKPVASPLLTLEPSGKRVAAAATPFRDRTGEVTGIVGGHIDLTSASLAQIVSPVKLGETGYIEVIDSQGAVLASTRPELLFSQSDHDRILAGLIVKRATLVSRCHSCHTDVAQGRETEVMAFAPLTFFSWGVSVRQSEREALAPARGMQVRFIIFGVAFVLFAILLSVGIARSVVRPVNLLRASAGRIAAGNLEEPIRPMGRDELGELGQSLEMMRLRLKESLEAIQRWNRELEAKVKDRTSDLEAAEAARADLLKRLIYAQEEERQRIARELHDETSQNMARMTMSLDRAVQASDACHSEVYDTYERSAHGAALAEEGNPDVPTCTYCHGVHNIYDPRQASFRSQIPQLCGQCHSNKPLMAKYGLSTNVVTTYLADFHGATNVFTRRGSPDIRSYEAVCTDCHGIHDIIKTDDPSSPVFWENLVQVCRQCHPDATANFPAAWMGHYEPSIKNAPVVFAVKMFYRIFIPFMVGGLLVQVLLNIWRAASNR